MRGTSSTSQGARHLVAGDLVAQERVELVQRRVGARARLHDRGDALAVPLVGDADDERVVDVGVGLERHLDLFGVDLLAAGVDRVGAAAEQGDRAVRLDPGEVAGHRVALAVDLENVAAVFSGSL